MDNSLKLTINQEAIINNDSTIKGQFFNEDDKFMAAKFVDSILKCYPMNNFITPINDQGGKGVWMYNDDKGIFQNIGVPWMEEKLKKILGQSARKSYYSSVIKHFQVSTYTDPKEFEETPRIIVLKNGSFNIMSGTMVNNSPEYKAKNMLPITYDLSAKCPKFLKFLERVLPKQELRDFFQEWLGYHLLKDYRYQRVVVLQGDGDNGKSTLLSVMLRFLGHENVSSENLYRLSTNRFSPAELHGKLGNISADIGPEELKYTGIIKTLTGNDYITVEHKNRDPFQFTNYAKMMFSCNQLPRTPDESLAFYKRFIVLVTGDPIPKEEQDPQLLEKLTTPEELSGLLNWALEGLKRCLKRGRLQEPTDIQERKELYQNMSDPVTGFYNDFIEENSESFEIKQDVLNAFNDYCRNKGFVAYSDRKFMERFKKIAYIRAYRPKLWTDETPKGKQHHCMKGIKLSDACRSTQYWTSKEDYQTARGKQKSLTPKKNIASDSQDSQNSQGSLTCLKKTPENRGDIIEADYHDYPNYKLHPVSQDLVKKATSILKLNGNQMTQQAFFDQLEKNGFNSKGAEYKLREDPRFAFRGVNVHLVRSQ